MGHCYLAGILAKSGEGVCCGLSGQAHSSHSIMMQRSQLLKNKKSTTKESTLMLQLRPNCEYCDKDLPPTSIEARICTYECTFCAECVDTILHNVCPNCAGGFVPRPIRPSKDRRKGVSLRYQPASTKRVHLKYKKEEIAEFVANVKDIDAKER